MGKAPKWTEDHREELRETLRNLVVGEVRLSKRDNPEILAICEDWIEEDCPAPERPEFAKFAAEALDRAAADHLRDQQNWPAVTDSDRLDRVVSALRERGIVLWQASVCCDTCSFDEMPSHLDALEKDYPNVRDNLRGYAFFHDQNMPDHLSEGTEIDVYLSYGWVPRGEADVPQKVLDRNSVEIGKEVAEALRSQGLEVDWNGKHSKKIGLSINWQRRTRLPYPDPPANRH